MPASAFTILVVIALICFVASLIWDMRLASVGGILVAVAMLVGG